MGFPWSTIKHQFIHNTILCYYIITSSAYYQYPFKGQQTQYIDSWTVSQCTSIHYTGLYVASVEFCNSLNVMLSNLSRMSKSSWPTVNHPTYDLNALLSGTTLAHGISISLRVRVDKRNFDTWLESTSTCLHSYLCVWLISGVL